MMTIDQAIEIYHNHNPAFLTVDALKQFFDPSDSSYVLSYSTAKRADRFSDQNFSPYGILHSKVFAIAKQTLVDAGKEKRAAGQLEGDVIEDAIFAFSEIDFEMKYFAFDKSERPNKDATMRQRDNAEWKKKLIAEAEAADKKLIDLQLFNGAISVRRRLLADDLFLDYTSGIDGIDYETQSYFETIDPVTFIAYKGYRDLYREHVDRWCGPGVIELKTFNTLSLEKVKRQILTKLFFGQLPAYMQASRADFSHWLFVQAKPPFSYRWFFVDYNSQLVKKSLHRFRSWLESFSRINDADAWSAGYDFIDGELGALIDMHVKVDESFYLADINSSNFSKAA